MRMHNSTLLLVAFVIGSILPTTGKTAADRQIHSYSYDDDTKSYTGRSVRRKFLDHQLMLHSGRIDPHLISQQLDEQKQSISFPFDGVNGGSPVHSEGGAMGDIFSIILGTENWPLEGQEQRPKLGEVVTANVMAWALFFYVGFTMLATFKLAILSLATAKASTWTNPFSNFMFPAHFFAISSAIIWKNAHLRAMPLQLLRIAVPATFTIIIYRMRETLNSRFFNDEGKFDSLETHLDFTAPIVDFMLTVALIYIAMTSMLFFLWQLSSEASSGMRRLLHISGVSRIAHLLGTAGVEGIFFPMVATVCLLVFAVLLRIRLVLWTSSALIMFQAFTMVLSAVLVAYLINHILTSERLSGMVGKTILAVVIFTTPLTPLLPVIPHPGEQSMLTLALPVIPLYRGIFEDLKACQKGRCLDVGDMVNGILHGKWVSPSVMALGTTNQENLSPPEAIISYWGLALVQLVIGWSALALMECHRYPQLCDNKVSLPELEGDCAIIVNKLSFCYGWAPSLKKRLGLTSAAVDDMVLKSVDFSIEAGSTLGLLGPNGAGKTSAIRCITGEELPCEGSVKVIRNGRGRAIIGLCPQDSVLNKDLTVAENLRFFAYIRCCYGAAADVAVDEFLEATSLRGKQHDFPDSLSGGMRRRLAVGCAMIGKPTVTILDEPTTGLDPLSRRGIWSTIEAIRGSGGCCLLTTHMLEEAEALCSHLVIFRRGVVVAQGTVQELKARWNAGYLLTVESEVGKGAQCISFVQSLLPVEDREPMKMGCTKVSSRTFSFSGNGQALGQLIITLSNGKETNGIRNWGVSQASLEDTYVRIIAEDSGASRYDTTAASGDAIA